MRLSFVALILAAIIGPSTSIVSKNDLRPIWVIGDPHVAAAGGNKIAITLRHARAAKVAAVISGGDLTFLTSGGDGGVSDVNTWKTLVHDTLGTEIPVYGGLGNHDFATDISGSGYFHGDSSFTAQDSLDPMWKIREIVPQMDAFGNYSKTVGNCKFVFLNNWCREIGDSMKVGTVKSNWQTALWGTGYDNWAAHLYGLFYWPPNLYPGWNVKNGPVWQWVYNEIKTCDVPFLFFIFAMQFWEIQGDGSAGYCCWAQDQPTTVAGDTVTIGDLMQETTTALGYHVTGDFGFHTHHVAVLGPERNDSLVTYASGGRYHFIGPHNNASHAPAYGAWDSAGASTFPDTCNRSNFASWSTHHWTPGHLLTFHDRQLGSDAGPWHWAIEPLGWNKVDIVLYDSTDTNVRWRTGQLGPR